MCGRVGGGRGGAALLCHCGAVCALRVVRCCWASSAREKKPDAAHAPQRTPPPQKKPQNKKAKRTDVIFFCSPNNPTGAAATRAQLTRLVEFARANKSLLVYDAAYALYITNPDCPKSIFEIEGESEGGRLVCARVVLGGGHEAARAGHFVCARKKNKPPNAQQQTPQTRPPKHKNKHQRALPPPKPKNKQQRALPPPPRTHTHKKKTKGADEVALETCSFSKYAGFTGVRLGWTVVPKKLQYPGGGGGSVHADWNRVMTTCFNGASNIVQAGGLACLQVLCVLCVCACVWVARACESGGARRRLAQRALHSLRRTHSTTPQRHTTNRQNPSQPEGLEEMTALIKFYKENAAILKTTFEQMGFSVYGGVDAPYVWVGFPGRPSWDVFAEILERCDIVTTPGSGFGPAGEGFVRASAFGSRANIEEAVRRFKAEYGGKK